MGCCVKNPGEYGDMMKEHKEKGLLNKMDEERKTADGKPLRRPGWAEMFITMGALAVAAVVLLLL